MRLAVPSDAGQTLAIKRVAESCSDSRRVQGWQEPATDQPPDGGNLATALGAVGPTEGLPAWR